MTPLVRTGGGRLPISPSIADWMQRRRPDLEAALQGRMSGLVRDEMDMAHGTHLLLQEDEAALELLRRNARVGGPPLYRFTPGHACIVQYQLAVMRMAGPDEVRAVLPRSHGRFQEG